MKILIGYDGSTYADTAIDDLQWAGIPPKAEAIVLSSIEWPTTQAIKSWGMVETDFSPEWTKRIASAEALADAGAYRLQKLFPQWNVQIEPSAENPAEAILEKAKHWPADLIVVGTHGRSALARVVLGSVSLRLVREASCPVRVARAAIHNDPLRLLIGIDGSPEAAAAVAEVCRRSWHAGPEIRMLAVQEVIAPLNAERIAIGGRIYEQMNEDELFRLRSTMDMASETLHEAGLLATPIVEQGDPKHVLLSESRNWNADTIFLGSRGLGRAKGFILGSVSAATVAHAPCTVEVVHLLSSVVA
jgi:nucleotide-binding universal stress UspA family protein